MSGKLLFAVSTTPSASHSAPLCIIFPPFLSLIGNLKEPVFAVDHVFCDTTKTLHAHFENAPQLIDVTLR